MKVRERERKRMEKRERNREKTEKERTLKGQTREDSSQARVKPFLFTPKGGGLRVRVGPAKDFSKFSSISACARSASKF